MLPPGIAYVGQNDRIFQNACFIVCKVTEACNLGCHYCSAEALNARNVRIMSTETFRKIVTKLLDQSQSQRIGICFHGGEPMLLPIDWYRANMDWAIAEAKSRGREVFWLMQSNCTLVTDEFAKLVTEYDIDVGTSLDGSPEISDELRQEGWKVVEGIKKLEKAHKQPGVISLITYKNWERWPEILEFFDGQGILDLKCNIYYNVGRGRGLEEMTPDKVFHAKKVILDHMIATRGRRVQDVNLRFMIEWYAVGLRAPSMDVKHGCNAFFCGGGSTHFGFQPNGDFFPCGRATHRFDWKLGSIHDVESADAIDYYHDTHEDFHTKNGKWAECVHCDAKRICNFSCTAYTRKANDNMELECVFTKMMYAHFVERSDEIVQLAADLKHARDNGRSFVDIEGMVGDKNPTAQPHGEIDSSLAGSLVQFRHNQRYLGAGGHEVEFSTPMIDVLRVQGRTFAYQKRYDRLFEIERPVYEALRLVDLAGEEATREMLTSRYGPELAADAAREARSLTANVAPRAESVAAGA